MRAALVLILLSGLMAAPAVASERLPRAPKHWLGTMADGPMTGPGGAPAGEWNRMRRAGVRSVRLAFYWDHLEPEPGRFDFSTTDGLVAKSVSRGMQPIPVVIRAPAWSRNGNGMHPPRSAASFGPVMDALARRYGSAGSFWTERPRLPRKPVRYWQIWNEPQLQLYWWTRPFAPSYVDLLEAGAASARAADPRARIVLAGLTNASWEPLREIYEAGGRGAFDVVALHPYTGHPDNVLKIIRRNRRVMREFGDGRLPVWVTETCWAAIDQDRVYAEPTWKSTPRAQAELLRATFKRLAQYRKRLRIGKALWYTWLSGYRKDDWTDYCGLRRVRGGETRALPALKQFKRVARALRR